MVIALGTPKKMAKKWKGVKNKNDSLVDFLWLK